MAETTVRMPKLSMTMEEGEIVAWQVAEGADVKAGDVLCQVVTDKTEMDVDAPAEGRVLRVLAAAGATVEVGGPLVVLATSTSNALDDLLGDPLQTPAAPQPVEPPVAQPDGSVAQPDGSVAQPDGSVAQPDGSVAESAAVAGAAVRAVPAARSLARSLGIEITSIRPTRPDRVVTVDDVVAAAPPAAAPPPAVGSTPGRTALASTPNGAVVGSTPDGAALAATPNGTPLTGRRAALARSTAVKMTASAEVPQFTLHRAVDLDHAERHRKGISWNTLLGYAAVVALKEHPRLNGTWTGQDVVVPENVVLGVAVDSPDGLVVCAIPGAGGLGLAAFDDALSAGIDRARQGKMNESDRVAPTFSLSNLGSLGIDWFQALVTPPQAAVLSLGRVRRGVEATDDGLRLRRECQVGITVDHRVANGADGARFLATFADLLGRSRFTDLLLGGR